MGRHVGSGLLIGAAAYYGPSLLAGPDVLAELGWGVHALPLGVAAWLVTWPWACLAYSADAKQARVMASVVGVSFALLTLIAHWALPF